MVTLVVPPCELRPHLMGQGALLFLNLMALVPLTSLRWLEQTGSVCLICNFWCILILGPLVAVRMVRL